MKKCISILFIFFTAFAFGKTGRAEEPVYQYRTEYYYDGVMDPGATVYKVGAFASFILDYETRNKDGYIFSHSSIDEGGLTITSDESKNVIQVFYEKKDADIKVSESENSTVDTDTMLFLKQKIHSILDFLKMLVTS